MPSKNLRLTQQRQNSDRLGFQQGDHAAIIFPSFYILWQLSYGSNKAPACPFPQSWRGRGLIASFRQCRRSEQLSCSPSCEPPQSLRGAYYNSERVREVMQLRPKPLVEMLFRYEQLLRSISPNSLPGLLGSFPHPRPTSPAVPSSSIIY